MARFVRKNELIISGRFFVKGSPSTQPSSATAVLSYENTSGSRVQDTISLANGGSPDYIWSGAWDSSAARAGRVDWMVYGAGDVIAATEGFFEIAANRANTV